jgi:hypothetical protein
MENKAKIQPNHLISVEYPMGQVEDITEDSPMKLGQFGANQGVVAPPLAPLEPIFHRQLHGIMLGRFA